MKEDDISIEEGGLTIRKVGCCHLSYSRTISTNCRLEKKVTYCFNFSTQDISITKFSGQSPELFFEFALAEPGGGLHAVGFSRWVGAPWGNFLLLGTHLGLRHPPWKNFYPEPEKRSEIVAILKF